MWVRTSKSTTVRRTCLVSQSCLTLQPLGLHHARLPCPSPSPRIRSNSCLLSQWCCLTISSSATPFSSCLQSFSVSGSFPVGQLFTSGGQNMGASASVLPMNIQGWFSLGLTGLISLQNWVKENSKIENRSAPRKLHITLKDHSLHNYQYFTPSEVLGKP